MHEKVFIVEFCVFVGSTVGSIIIAGVIYNCLSLC